MIDDCKDKKWQEKFPEKKPNIIIETPVGQNKRSEEQISAAKKELNELYEIISQHQQYLLGQWDVMCPCE